MSILEKMKAELLAEHAELLSQGFPKSQTSLFWRKVDELPEEHGEEVRKLAELAGKVKSAHSERTR
jgi:hypothetical protein